MDNIQKDLRKLDKLFDSLAAAAPATDAEVYQCTRCRDTGFVLQNNATYHCFCQRPQYIEQLKRRAGLTARLRRMRFDTFDLGYYSDRSLAPDGISFSKKAERAVENAQKFVTNCVKKQANRGLLLQGDIGCGKTHLAAAIANALAEQGVESLFLVVPEFLDQLRGSYRQENEGLDESEIIKQAYEVPVLILDDMGAHNFTDWVSNKLFTIINHRYNRNLPFIITTNLDAEQMDANIGSRTTSRIYEACARNTLYIDHDVRLQQRLGRRV